MKAGSDPRTDQHPSKEVGPSPEVGKSNPKPAPGGAGTGTKGDPAHEPAAQPGKK